jgi:hypothetical protein
MNNFGPTIRTIFAGIRGAIALQPGRHKANESLHQWPSAGVPAIIDVEHVVS